MEETRFGFKLIQGHKSTVAECRPLGSQPVQQGLFPFGQGRCLIFVCFPSVTEREFVSLVRTAQPAVAVELRRAPRFDIGRLTRQLVFKFFEDAKCRYYDPIPHPQPDCNDLKNWLAPALDISEKDTARPIMFFLSDAEDTRVLRQRIYNAFADSDRNWEVYDVGKCCPESGPTAP